MLIRNTCTSELHPKCMVASGLSRRPELELFHLYYPGKNIVQSHKKKDFSGKRKSEAKHENVTKQCNNNSAKQVTVFVPQHVVPVLGFATKILQKKVGFRLDCCHKVCSVIINGSSQLNRY